MAQRMIHYLIGTRLLEEMPVCDRMRFLLGSILPDAYASRRKRDDTHYVQRTPDNRVYYDSNSFHARYREAISRDPLYLGYYMHLVEDIFYRTYIRKDRHLDIFGHPDAVALLHRDYHCLNRYIVDTYGLCNEVILPMDLEKEALVQEADFAIEAFLEEFDRDFHETLQEKTVFITEAMLEEFLSRYYGQIKEEYIHVLQQNEPLLQAYTYAWIRTGG